MAAFPVSVSAKISIKASVDRTVIGLKNEIEYTLVVTGVAGTIPNPKIPRFPEFDVVNTSRSSSYSFDNGDFSSTKTIRIILAPRSIGTFTLPPTEIEADGRVSKSESFTITVKEGAVQNISESPVASSPSPSSPPIVEENPKIRGDLFGEMVINKKQAYVGEQLILSYRFYRRIQLFRQPEYDEPDVTGFWVEELLSKRTEEVRIINNHEYFVQEINSALFPTAPGDYTIGSATLRVRTGFFTQPHLLISDPISLKILPLPEKGKPPGFSGAVGNFKLSAFLDKKTVAAEKPVTLIFTVAGDGNIKTIRQPDIKIPEGFRKYKSKTVENITPDPNRVTGEKRYETILVPQKEGDYQIEPIRFTYFDPDSATYNTLLSPPLSLTVTRGEKEIFQEPVAPTLRQTEIASFNKDIRFLKLYEGDLEDYGDFLFEHPWFWPLQSIPVLVMFILFLYKEHKKRSSTDVRSLRLRRAHKMAGKRLRVAEGYRKAGDSTNFHKEISRALCEYLGDKLNTAAQGLTQDKIREELSHHQKDIPSDRIESVISLLEQCDMTCFASKSSTDEEMKQFLAETEDVIVKLDKLM